MVCWGLSVLSQYRERGRDEHTEGHTQELDGEEKPGKATTCKCRCVSGETAPILPSSEYISAGTIEEMHGPCFKVPDLCCLLWQLPELTQGGQLEPLGSPVRLAI